MKFAVDWRMKVGEHLFEGLISIICENYHRLVFCFKSNRDFDRSQHIL